MSVDKFGRSSRSTTSIIRTNSEIIALKQYLHKTNEKITTLTNNMDAMTKNLVNLYTKLNGLSSMVTTSSHAFEQLTKEVLDYKTSVKSDFDNSIHSLYDQFDQSLEILKKTLELRDEKLSADVGKLIEQKWSTYTNKISKNIELIHGKKVIVYDV